MLNIEKYTLHEGGINNPYIKECFVLINVPASCIVLKQVFCYSAVNVQKLYGFIFMSTRLRYKLLLIIKKKGNGRNYQQ